MKRVIFLCKRHFCCHTFLGCTKTRKFRANGSTRPWFPYLKKGCLIVNLSNRATTALTSQLALALISWILALCIINRVLYHPVVQMLFTLPGNLQLFPWRQKKQVCAKSFHQHLISLFVNFSDTWSKAFTKWHSGSQPGCGEIVSGVPPVFTFIYL